MWKLVLPLSLLFACKSHDPTPAPTSAPPTTVVTTDGTHVDPKLAADIVQTAAEVLDAPAAPISAETKAQAVDASKLLGTWNLKHTISTIDYKAREPSEPLMPMTWTFGSDGTFTTHGGNELAGTYVLTKEKLVVSAFGSPLEYTVDNLTASDLAVTMTITPGMTNTTVLERVK